MSAQETKLTVIKTRCEKSVKFFVFLKIVAVIGMVCCILGAIAMVAVPDMNGIMAEQYGAGNLTVDQMGVHGGLIDFDIDYEAYFAKGNYVFPFLCMIGWGAGISVLILVIISMFEKILKSLIAEENPFSDNIMKQVRVAFIFSTIVCALFVGVGCGLLVGLMMWCIYAILEYGAALQTEVDETL
ncbi:MAG: hypothetical protein K5891_01740 [Lachnospiraceae bacterium]|nr:hypothetical protein [Lachnospiraceae bacterium]